MMWTGNVMARLLPKEGIRPGPLLQKVNVLVHREPYQSVLYHLYWTCVLVFVMPLMGVCLLLLGVVKVLRQLVSYAVSGEMRQRTIDPQELLHREKNNGGVELAVLITGCDSGLGHQLALRLAKEGIVVFAGCYQNPTDSKPFANNAEAASSSSRSSRNIRPLWLDVTNQEHVDRAYREVEDWRAFRDNSGEHDDPGGDAGAGQPVGNPPSRHFYALLNNAGVARGGYVDWCQLSDYEQCLEVNCLGQIRVCQSLLPIFQHQAIQQRAAASQKNKNSTHSAIHATMRIININSIAGHLPSGPLAGSPYEVSKNAAASFTDGLRLELAAWGIDVTSVDPSFHESPMGNAMATRDMIRNTVWDRLPKHKQEQYGTAFLDTYLDHLSRTITSGLWDLDGLVNTVVEQCVLSAAPPPAQLLVGMDAKFGLSLLHMLPPGWRQFLFRVCMPPQTPAVLLSTWTTTTEEEKLSSTKKTKST